MGQVTVVNEPWDNGVWVDIKLVSNDFGRPFDQQPSYPGYPRVFSPQQTEYFDISGTQELWVARETNPHHAIPTGWAAPLVISAIQTPFTDNLNV